MLTICYHRNDSNLDFLGKVRSLSVDLVKGWPFFLFNTCDFFSAETKDHNSLGQSLQNVIIKTKQSFNFLKIIMVKDTLPSIPLKVPLARTLIPLLLPF